MKHNSQEILWNTFEMFFQGFKGFQDICSKFDSNIANLCTNRETIKKELMYSLRIEDWVILVNIQDFRILLDKNLRPLRNMLDQLLSNYYSPNFSVSSFERYVRDIYYDFAMLYSECHYFNSQALASLESSNDLLPKKISETLFTKMERIKELFQCASAEFEKLLKGYESEVIILRSLYLFGKEILNGISPNAFSELIQRIYGKDELLELYIRVAYSFLNSGFHQQALDSANQAVGFLTDNTEKKFSEENKHKLQEFFRSHQAFMNAHNL